MRACPSRGWLAGARLNFTNPLLKYSNEAVMPFYVLHQPIIVLVGYLVIVPMQLPVPAKYLLTLVLCFPLIVGLWEFGVRRSGVLRFLFGLSHNPRPDSL